MLFLVLQVLVTAVPIVVQRRRTGDGGNRPAAIGYGQINGQIAGIGERHEIWQRQRQLAAPLTLGHPAPLIGDVIDRTVQQARNGVATAEGAIIGHPASTGRATGPVRIVHGPQDFAAFTDGDVLVAKTTAPAWTPLFARAAAVVTDSGSLAARLPGSARVRNPSSRRHRRRHPPTFDGPDHHRRRNGRHRDASQRGVSASRILRYPVRFARRTGNRSSRALRP
jgi:hypothetical protein